MYKLLEYNLIENVGKADLPGKPTMYSVTKEFMKMFGLTSLDELPELPRYKLDENRQIVIDEILEAPMREREEERDSSIEIKEEKEKEEKIENE